MVVTAEQALDVVRRLEPKSPLTYKQLRDLEARRCVLPQTLPGARAPRVYEAGDVLLLRLIARMQADPLLARWQAWSVVANLREALQAALLAGRHVVLVVQGAVGRLVTAREAVGMVGVEFDLATIPVGVREAMRQLGGDVWTGSQWVPARQALALARPLAEVTG